MTHFNDVPVTDVIADVLLNATDYIGNRPECFGADNHDLDIMRNNINFREKVGETFTDDMVCDEITWDVNSQEMCADYVWDLYLQWSDGPC